MTTLAIRLPLEVSKRLQRLAKTTGRTKTYYAREAILLHLDELEDKYVASQRLEEPDRRWTLDELERDADA